MARGFDVLVLGAGSAGSVVAARLSEDPACRVGLIEAGGMPADPDIADPLKWPALAGRSYDWAHRTVPQTHTAGRTHDWPRGRIVGGSSCLHAMAWVRGHHADFAPWAAAGGPAWSWERLEPAFARAEATIPLLRPDTELSPVVRAFMAAAEGMGVPHLGDHNRGLLCGTAPNTLTIAGGRRVSVADAYLTPALGRPNLALLTGRAALAITFDGRRATGATLAGPAGTETLAADRIVLCLGAIGSPLLLMRSGIGPRAALAEAGIPLRHDLPGVGENLQDHMLGFGNVYRSSRPVPPSRLQHSESLLYLASGAIADAAAVPDVVVACAVIPIGPPGADLPAPGLGWTLLFGATRPQSRGVLRPTGPGPADLPLIDPRYLEAPEDRAALRRALDLARAIAQRPELAPWRDAEILPAPGTDPDAFVAAVASTHHHPAGTCALGTVVDGRLAVQGTEALFVADASILPTLPSGPVNAAVVAVAETFAAAQATGAK